VAPSLDLGNAGPKQVRPAKARSKLRQSRRRQSPLKLTRLSAAASAVALASGMIVPSSTETAVANGDTRTLNLYHTHTGESIQATFRVNGSYDSAVLEKLNYFLRDWRNNDRTRMDPRLFDVIWEVYRTAGATQPIAIVSAYRSPQTNAMLRSRSRGVAEHSQHILGRAMDTTMPGMSMEKIREIGIRLQRGGVGWYPGSNFVHLDVASVRAWPRMSYDQLVRLFPDGKTVHLAADGRALVRYQEARAEIASRGGVMSDVPQSAPGAGLFAWLFGKRDEAPAASPAETAPRQASLPSRGRRGATERVALHTTGASPAPANFVVPAERPNVPTSPEGERTHVADLEPAISLRGVNGGPEQLSSERQTGAAAEVVKGKIDKRAVGLALAPLPPPRPSQAKGEIAVVFADVPTPPARPASLTRVASLSADKGHGLDSKLASAGTNNSVSDGVDAPLARAANLPVMIRNGPGDQDQESVPKQVLAFAADVPLQDSLPQAVNKPIGDAASKPAAPQFGSGPARPDRPKLRGLSNSFPAAFPAPSILGQSLTGLRRAARLIPGALSNKPLAANYASSFGSTPSDLDPDRFAGAAVKSLTLAQGFVRITKGPGPVGEN
jgi:uncharacterized protein YcbK (DUF882 family)